MSALALTLLAGCDSTQQQAARARLKSARFIASSARTVVRGRNPDVRVVGVRLLRGTGGTAITVRLHNDSARPLNDLPISVGIAGPAGRRTYLNASATGYYFANHLASIGARGSLTWVFTTPRKVPIAATPFAAIGARASVAPTKVRTLPPIDIAAAGTLTSAHGTTRLLVKVTNASAVPQYQLQIYALGLARGRYVAAGRATMSHLGTHSSNTVALNLIGGPRPTSVALEALPTMFQ